MKKYELKPERNFRETSYGVPNKERCPTKLEALGKYKQKHMDGNSHREQRVDQPGQRKANRSSHLSHLVHSKFATCACVWTLSVRLGDKWEVELTRGHVVSLMLACGFRVGNPELWDRRWGLVCHGDKTDALNTEGFPVLEPKDCVSLLLTSQVSAVGPSFQCA